MIHCPYATCCQHNCNSLFFSIFSFYADGAITSCHVTYWSWSLRTRWIHFTCQSPCITVERCNHKLPRYIFFAYEMDPHYMTEPMYHSRTVAIIRAPMTTPIKYCSINFFVITLGQFACNVALKTFILLSMYHIWLIRTGRLFW